MYSEERKSRQTLLSAALKTVSPRRDEYRRRESDLRSRSSSVRERSALLKGRSLNVGEEGDEDQAVDKRGCPDAEDAGAREGKDDSYRAQAEANAGSDVSESEGTWGDAGGGRGKRA
jgi:hypothetical protein